MRKLTELIPFTLKFAICYFLILNVNSSLAAECRDVLAKKTISIVVKVAPGGGYDLAARLIANQLEKNQVAPRIVVRNLPGAQGMIATNYLLEDKPGEIAIGFFDLYSLYESGEFDDKNFSALIGVTKQERAWISRRNDMLESIPDTGVVVANYISLENIVSVAMTAHLLNIKARYLASQTDSNSVVGVILRGEADISSLSVTSARRAVKSGDIGVMLSITNSPSPLFPEAPYLAGQGGVVDTMTKSLTETERANKMRLADQIVALSNNIRAIHIRSGADEATQSCLEDVLTRTLSAPELIEEARKADLDVKVISRSQIQDTYNNIKAIKNELRPFIDDMKNEMQGKK